MKTIDLNCDLGEGFPNDESIMPFISSVNIACGYHAGDEYIMNKTVELALKNEVAIGAHPGFPDKANFGRKDMDLSNEEYFDLIREQLESLKKVTDAFDTKISHIKPHGALYNKSASDEMVAKLIAEAIADYDRDMIVYGLSGSCSIFEAEALGLKTVNEVFCDRRYDSFGKLCSRQMKDAIIYDQPAAIAQAVKMIKESQVISLDGKLIQIKAESICIHGDHEQAVHLTKNLYKAFKMESIMIASLR